MPVAPQPAVERVQQPGRKFEQFWRRVTQGLALQQLWSQFEKDARSSYRLYSADLDSEKHETQIRNPYLRKVGILFWAILEKMSPARRVLLLVAMVLLLFPSGGFSYQDKSGDVHIAELDTHVYGGILLFVLLMLEVSDRVVMKRDLEIAREIQQWLLPGAPPQIPGISIAYVTQPANTVAGDYYDVFPRPGRTPADDRLLIAVADVAGKSIPAAMLMATFQASLKTLSSTRAPFPDLVTGMNTYACGNSSGGLRFTTAFLAEYDPATHNLTYINAGHNPPILRRANGAIEHLECGGLPLGILPTSTYESGFVALNSGDWLVIFTDGVVEAVNVRGEEYGEDRLCLMIERNASGSPAQLLEASLHDLEVFVGNTPQHDDVTCLFIKAT
jgi:sigma-B regulation protein RsbU (phosphoserine phosphatase)